MAANHTIIKTPSKAHAHGGKTHTVATLRMLISIWILSLVISRPGGGHSVCQAVRLRRICSPITYLMNGLRSLKEFL